MTLPDGLTGADQVGPGPDVMLQETGKNLMKITKPVNTRPVVEVDRKTELQGMYTKASPTDPAQVRKRTERDLKSPGSDIPYAKTERAVRDLVFSLLERQDRMNADLFLEINAMQEDIGMLKDQVYKLRIMKTSPAAPGAKKVTGSATAGARKIEWDGVLPASPSDQPERIPGQVWITIQRSGRNLPSIQRKRRS